MKLFIYLTLLTSFIYSNNTIPSSVKQFIPNGYGVLNFTKGNLNRDGIDDAILILKKLNEENFSEESPKRPLYILTGKKDGSYKLEAKNKNCVLGIKDGGILGDPFSAVAIKNGYFSLEFYGGSSWRWVKIVTFRYRNDRNNWFLHREGDESYHASEPSKIKREMKTTKNFGIILFSKYNIFKNF